MGTATYCSLSSILCCTICILTHLSGLCQTFSYLPMATEGEALERSSAFSLLSKEWNNTYWVVQGNLLLLYPNKEAYNRVRSA